jgi:D-glycerate 3-kinase
VTGSLEVVAAAVEGWLKVKRPLVLGICGAQGSGKSTLSMALAERLTARALTVALLSLDDLYLPPDRRPLDISPLFATRGVPGTHDVGLGDAVLNALKAGTAVRLPRFDKAHDTPKPESEWPEAISPDVIIFEGWCVGAVPQAETDLTQPVNALEIDRDPKGGWRAYANSQLVGPYQALFRHIDRLVFLAAPGFEAVQAWRTEQEHALAARLAAEGRTGTHVMTDAEVAIFIQHYERLTRHILAEMPGRADLTLHLDAQRRLISS